MSEARQKSKAKDVHEDVELVKQQKREKEAATKTKTAAKKGTTAGQDPENTNIYDTLATVEGYRRDYERIETSKVRTQKQIQEAQIEKAEKTHAEIEKNRDKYTPESYAEYETAYNEYITEANRNVAQMDEAIRQGEQNREIRNENITYLNRTAVNPPTAPRAPKKTSPPSHSLDVGPEGTAKQRTQKQEFYIDAKGEIEKRIAEKAQDKITSINTPTREYMLKEKGGEQFESYENRFQVTTKLRTKAYMLGTEAREPLEEGKPANLLKVVAASGLAFTAGATDALTAPIRPGLIAKSVKGANELGTPEGRSQAVQTFAADPTSAIFGFAGSISGGVILSNIVPPKVETRSTYKYPSELGETPPGRVNYVQPTRYPKGTRFYTDYSGELRPYMPASERWNRLVMGGDQFMNQDVLVTQPTVSQVKPVTPYQQFSRTPAVSPVKVTTVTVTPRVSQGTGVFGATLINPRGIEEDESVEKTRNMLTKKPTNTPIDISDVKPVSKPKPTQTPLPAQLPIPVEAETPIEKSVNTPRLDQPPILETPDPNTPQPNKPIPPIFTPPSSYRSTPRLNIQPRREKKKKHVKSLLKTGFERRSYSLLTPSKIITKKKGDLKI